MMTMNYPHNVLPPTTKIMMDASGCRFGHLTGNGPVIEYYDGQDRSVILPVTPSTATLLRKIADSIEKNLGPDPITPLPSAN